MSTTYVVNWLHIPTGSQGESLVSVKRSPPNALPHVLALVNQWNAKQPKTWKYWLDV